MPTDPNESRLSPAQEVERLVKESGRTQREVADYLSQKIPGGRYSHYHISRMIQGQRRVTAAEMDALRDLITTKGRAELLPSSVTFMTTEPVADTGDMVPLFGGPGARIILSDEYNIGILSAHPAQRGARGAFAVQLRVDTMGDRIRFGEIAYAIRNRAPEVGKPCLVELNSGDCHPVIYERQDANTLHGRTLKPNAAVSWPLRDVKAVHAIVGVSF